MDQIEAMSSLSLLYVAYTKDETLTAATEVFDLFGHV